MDCIRKRIMKEYEDFKKNQTENIVEVWLVSDDIHHWKGKIKGPVKFLPILDRFLL